MIRVTLRFYGDLNELIKNYEGIPFERSLPEPTSVKDLVEGCGVPHTEVDLLLVDGQPVDFDYLIEGGERVSVFPFIETIDIPQKDRLQQPALTDPRFLVDVNLGKLARYLRMAGFDTVYHTHAKDDDLVEQMLEEDRALLSRDRKLLMRKVVTCGYMPRSDQAAIQLEEVFRRFDLFDDVDPYTRCPNCNGMLQSVPKEQVLDQLEPLTKRHFDTFSQCPDCGQVYWAGSHRRRLNPRVKKLLDA
jgi:uncharacterized protein with PIN domain/sulfur carrier protein ThiS